MVGRLSFCLKEGDWLHSEGGGGLDINFQTFPYYQIKVILYVTMMNLHIFFEGVAFLVGTRGLIFFSQDGGGL